MLSGAGLKCGLASHFTARHYAEVKRVTKPFTIGQRVRQGGIVAGIAKVGGSAGGVGLGSVVGVVGVATARKVTRSRPCMACIS